MAAADLDVEHWSTADAADLYEVARWGNGYFSVGPTGHLLVHPDKDPTKSIDLKQLVVRLQVRGNGLIHQPGNGLRNLGILQAAPGFDSFNPLSHWNPIVAYRQERASASPAKHRGDGIIPCQRCGCIF